MQSASEVEEASTVQEKDSSPSKDRLQALEEEVKRMRQEKEMGSVDSALQQVRTLALRSTTPNGVLLSSMESLYDTAVRASHEDQELYKTALRACRENDTKGDLHGLITKLIGTDSAKKAQTAIEAWSKTMRKMGKDKEQEKAKGKMDTTVGTMPRSMGPQSYGQGQGQGFLYYPRARGRGYSRGGYNRPPRACFICKSLQHMVANCPQNPSAEFAVVKTESK